MCRTVHALLQVVICGIQMLVRVFMTVILMIENLIRMILQTFYNFISFMLQLISLIPICVVFLLSTRLKCFMCGGGGPCPVARGGTCDCLMSGMAIVILFLIFRATGVLDKIFYKIGYVKARPIAFTKFVPTPGEITECSRDEENSTIETDTYDDDFLRMSPDREDILSARKSRTKSLRLEELTITEDMSTETTMYELTDTISTKKTSHKDQPQDESVNNSSEGADYASTSNWTTVLYYLV